MPVQFGHVSLRDQSLPLCRRSFRPRRWSRRDDPRAAWATISARAAYARAASQSIGATVITPHRRSRAAPAMASMTRAKSWSASRPVGGSRGPHGAAPGRVAVEADLHEHIEPRVTVPMQAHGLVGRAIEGDGQAHPVDRVHQVGVLDNRPALVSLQLSYEMPPDLCPGRGHLRRLRRRLLVAVLPYVADAQVGQPNDVHRGERLRDRHQGHARRIPSGPGAGRRDPVPHGRQVRGQVPLARVGLRHDHPRSARRHLLDNCRYHRNR